MVLKLYPYANELQAITFTKGAISIAHQGPVSTLSFLNGKLLTYRIIVFAMHPTFMATKDCVTFVARLQ